MLYEVITDVEHGADFCGRAVGERVGGEEGSDAAGIRLQSLPMTRDKVLAALAEKA